MEQALQKQETSHCCEMPSGKVEYLDFAPAADIIEAPCGVRILMDMPGACPDCLTVNVESHILRATAETQLRRRGRFVRYNRSFALSDDLDPAKITAKLRDGVLELELPKTEIAQVRKIKVIEG